MGATSKAKKSLIKAEKDLTTKSKKLKQLKLENAKAEVALAALKVKLKERVKEVKLKAAGSVRKPQADVASLFTHARQGMLRMKAELQKQEEEVEVVEKMYEESQQKEEVEMGMANELLS